jgi:hypothetical protein
MLLTQNAYLNASAEYIYKNTGAASYYLQSSGAHSWATVASGSAGGTISAWTTAMTLDASGNLGIGTGSPAARLHVAGDIYISTTSSPKLIFQYSRIGEDLFDTDSLGLASDSTEPITFGTYNSGADTYSEKMRMTAGGDLLVGKTAVSNTTKGATISPSGEVQVTITNAGGGSQCVFLNREDADGDLILFRQANATEGSISVSGSTVSYNGGHLSRWSQFPDGSHPDLVKGTVMTNLDQMAVWINPETGEPEENEQLNCMKVSDVEGDVNVAGVFVNWDEAGDLNIAMTGDMIIRIAQGVTVQRGDLLMSAGDGTAKPQGDDIIRSKTIAKVTSTHVTCTYEDGSYCVPCVLMAC